MAETNGAAAGETTPQRNRWVWLLLLLLLLGLGGYFAATMRSGPPSPAEAGGFEITFTGVDVAGRSAVFKVVAPGQAHAWAFGDDDLIPLPEGAATLQTALAADLANSEGVIAVGLASREGTDRLNRQLASCRSLALAGRIADIQADAGVEAYRLVLGRYEDDELAENTDLERLIVLGFILESDDGVNIDQALRQGLVENLPAALDGLRETLARQLDVSRYACWGEDEFSVTPAGERRALCYRERSVDPTTFCGRF